MTKLYPKRLLRLAKFLREKVLRSQFDLEVWSCGTVACAAGWACRIPYFRRLGFLLEVGYDGKELENPYPTFEGNEGFPAIEKFFGLTERESGDIFSIYGYERAPTPKMVAKKIETFVSQKQKAV